MADIKLRIEVNPNAESEFLGNINTTNLNVANTSIPVSSIGEMEMPKTEFDGSNGLVWNTDFVNENGENDNYLVFNDNDELDNVENSGGYLESEENPDEFFWGLVPPNKEYRVKLTFTGASNLKDIIVFGDKVNNQFPTEAIVDGETTIYSDDYYWAINLGTESDTHTIEFTKWNRANYNACLTLIRVMLKYWEVDKFNGLKSVESLSQSTGQPEEIFYGVVPSQGTSEIIDVNGEIADMVGDGVIANSDIKVELFSNGNKVEEFRTTDSEYSTNGKIFNIELSNVLDKWKEIEIAEIKYKHFYSYDNLSRVLFDILMRLGYNNDEIEKSLSRKIVYGSTDREMEGTILEYLNSIYAPGDEQYHKKSSAYDIISEICSISQLNLFQNSEGELTFVSARPQRSMNENAIVIPLKNQKTKPNINIIKKNNYKNVKFTERISNSFVTETFNETLNIEYTEDGQIDVSKINLEDLSVTITDFDPNSQLLTFFKTVTTNSDLVRYDRNYDSERPFEYSVIYENGQSDVGSIPYIFSENKSKEDYDFTLDLNLDASVDRLTPYSTLNSEVFAITLRVPKNWRIKSINLVLKAKVLNISKTEKFINEEKNVYNYNLDSDLINNNLEYRTTPSSNPIKMYDIICGNIVNDYKDGIYNMPIDIICADYYDTHGNKVKEWRNGQVIEVGDIVRIDKDNYGNSFFEYGDKQPIYWRVVGRRFRYAGVPLIDLELQQIVNVELPEIIYFKRDKIEINGVNVPTFEFEKYATREIYYTLDGSTPTKKSNIYTEPFLLYDDTILNIKAIQVEGNAVSPVSSFVVTKGSTSFKKE